VDIHFTIKADPSSAISDMALDSRSMETITIEARLTPKPDSGDVADSSGSGSGSDGGGRSQSKPRLAGDDWSEALGVVLGQIVLKTEVDRRFFPRHEVRNLLESLTSDNLPTFRVVKEVVSVS
jgi:hypothetical protein